MYFCWHRIDFYIIIYIIINSDVRYMVDWNSVNLSDYEKKIVRNLKRNGMRDEEIVHTIRKSREYGSSAGVQNPSHDIERVMWQKKNLPKDDHSTKFVPVRSFQSIIDETGKQTSVKTARYIAVKHRFEDEHKIDELPPSRFYYLDTSLRVKPEGSYNSPDKDMQFKGKGNVIPYIERIVINKTRPIRTRRDMDIDEIKQLHDRMSTKGGKKLLNEQVIFDEHDIGASYLPTGSIIPGDRVVRLILKKGNKEYGFKDVLMPYTGNKSFEDSTTVINYRGTPAIVSIAIKLFEVIRDMLIDFVKSDTQSKWVYKELQGNMKSERWQKFFEYYGKDRNPLDFTDMGKNIRRLDDPVKSDGKANKLFERRKQLQKPKSKRVIKKKTKPVQKKKTKPVQKKSSIIDRMINLTVGSGIKGVKIT